MSSPATGPIPSPRTGAEAVVADAVAHNARATPAVDPARRPDVLLRKRRAEGHEMSVWWLIGAFVVVSGAVIALLSFVPGGA